MAKILLLEDSEDSQLIVEKALKGTGSELFVARTVAEARVAVARAKGEEFALFLLDLQLPDGSGIELLKLLQEQPETRHKPAILLTAEGEVDTKVKAFALGADDYLTKPVNPAELRARIEAKLRKNQGAVARAQIQRGILTLNPAQLQASNVVDGQSRPLDLTGKEFKILYFLMQHENRAFSRAEIVKAAWGEGVHIASRTVDSHVCSLRKKLGPAAAFIESVPALGYCFRGEPKKA